MDRKLILHILVLVSFYSAIRIPLMNKPLEFDETYCTSVYLHTSPISRFKPEKHIFLDGEFKWWDPWKTDWRRQTVMHPPFLHIFYFFWIRAFNESEISLHIPTFIAGLIGIIAMYFLGALLFSSDAAFLAALAVSFSVSHISLSVFAIHSVFEFSILVISLLYLSKFIITERKEMFVTLLMLNACGLFITYHYFPYLFIQTVVLWFYRNRIKIPRYYFICAYILMVLFFVAVIGVYVLRGYSHDFWMRSNFMTLLGVLTSLPYGELWVKETLSVTFFKCLLFLLFLIGCARMFFAFKKDNSPRNLLRFVLLATLALPFIFYLIMGSLVGKFGHARNLFYLLSIYTLIIYYGLEGLIRNKKLFYLFSLFICFFLLASGIASIYPSWKQFYLEREMINEASKLDSKFVVISNVNTHYRSFQYYAKRYGILKKANYWCFVNEIPAGSFALIENGEDGSSPYKDKYFFNDRPFKINKTICLKGNYGPYKFLQKFFQKPSFIFIYLLEGN